MTDIAVFNEICTVAFNVIYFSVILTTIFVVILDNRNPVKTMAWILVLFFLPVIGLIFLFLFWTQYAQGAFDQPAWLYPFE